MTADVNYASLLVDNNDGVIENIEMDVSFSLYYVNRGFGYVSRTGTGTVRNLLLKITTGNNSWQFSSLDDGYGKFIVCNGSIVENVLVIYDGHTNLIIPKGNNISAIVSENDYKTSEFDASKLDSEQWLISNSLPRIGQGSYYQVVVKVCNEDGSYVDITDQLDETFTNGAGVYGETIDLTNMAISLHFL
jgi:hypothetical protein